MENDKTTSKLVIKELQLSDSGRYELFAENTYHKQYIYVTLLVKSN